MKDRRSGKDRRNWGKRVELREKVRYNPKLTESELSFETGISKDVIKRVMGELREG